MISIKSRRNVMSSTLTFTCTLFYSLFLLPFCFYIACLLFFYTAVLFKLKRKLHIFIEAGFIIKVSLEVTILQVCVESNRMKDEGSIDYMEDLKDRSNRAIRLVVPS